MTVVRCHHVQRNMGLDLLTYYLGGRISRWSLKNLTLVFAIEKRGVLWGLESLPNEQGGSHEVRALVERTSETCYGKVTGWSPCRERNEERS